MIKKATIDGFGLSINDIKKYINIKEFKKFFDINVEGETFFEIEKNGFKIEDLDTYKSPLDDEIIINLFTNKGETYIFIPSVSPCETGFFKDEEEAKNFIFEKIKVFLKKNTKAAIFDKIGVLIEY